MRRASTSRSGDGSPPWRPAFVAVLVALLPAVGWARPGDITTYVGATSFESPLGMRVATTASGTQLYVADSSQHIVRHIDLATQRVSIVAGLGTRGSGVAAVSRPLGDQPPLLEAADARREAEELLAQFMVLFPNDAVVRTALRGAAAYHLSWFDSGRMQSTMLSMSSSPKTSSTTGSTAASAPLIRFAVGDRQQTGPLSIDAVNEACSTAASPGPSPPPPQPPRRPGA